MLPGGKKRKQQRKEEAAKARQNEAQAAEDGGERPEPTEARGVAEVSAEVVGSSAKMPPGGKKRKQQRKEEAAKARQNEAQAAEDGGERPEPTEARGVAEVSAEVVGPSAKMPPGGKKRKQQRKEEAAKARQNEAQAAENGGERTSPTEARGVAEEMAPAPLTGIDSLPPETLFAIFSFLPIPDLTRCAAVCERWHEIVTGFTRLWKGKSYTSGRSRRESVEVCAILHASPPPQEVTVKIGEFRVDFRYPHLFLSVRDVADLSSATYAGLPLLGNLRRLQLELQGDCMARGGLEAATRGVRRLASLQLDYGGESCERHCQREPRFEVWPVTPPVHWGYLQGNVIADKLSEAVARLPLLEDLHLRFWKLGRLDFLRHCPRLRCLCLEFSDWPQASQLSNLRHLANLEVLDLRACRVDADVLSGALPSLTWLHALSLSRAEGVAHLRFLRHCPQLRSLSLCGTVGLQKEAYEELCHLSNLETLNVNFDVLYFVRELVRPCLPKLKVNSSEGSNITPCHLLLDIV